MKELESLVGELTHDLQVVQSWQDVYEENVRAKGGEGEISEHGKIELRVQVRHYVVGNIPREMEWSQHDRIWLWSGNSRQLRSGFNWDGHS